MSELKLKENCVAYQQRYDFLVYFGCWPVTL